MDSDTIAQIVALVLFVAIRIIADRLKKKPEQPPPPERQPDWDSLPPEGDWGQPAPQRGPPSFPVPGDLYPVPEPSPSPMPELRDLFAEQRRDLAAKVERVADEADELLSRARLDRGTRRASAVLDEFVLPRARALSSELARETGAPSAEHYDRVSEIELVLAVTETLVAQRLNPVTRLALGDADQVAADCYEPLLEFARMNRLPLTSATPLTLLTPFDLATWTAFIPTGVAPIFLPRDFFHRVAWWPALAHEVAHDFLAATDNADDRLRVQLGLPREPEGQRPIGFAFGGIQGWELYRVFGAWFEELFCDVVGTLMVGAAYGHTMTHLFQSPRSPSRIATVRLDRTRRAYDIHPPRHLRVIVVSHVLDWIGERDAAKEMWADWTDAHGPVESIVFPVAGGQVGVPVEPLAHIATELAGRLYRDGLDAFDGHSLQDIPGIDYGPHEAQEARRARDALLAGQLPNVRHARSVISGAVLAWRQAPEREQQILATARRTIVGVTEHVEDVYDHAYGGDLPIAAIGGEGGDDPREAFIVHTVLSPPRPLRHLRPIRPGLVSRLT